MQTKVHLVQILCFGNLEEEEDSLQPQKCFIPGYGQTGIIMIAIVGKFSKENSMTQGIGTKNLGESYRKQRVIQYGSGIIQGGKEEILGIIKRPQ